MKSNHKTALVLTGILSLLCLCSILTILLYPGPETKDYIAYIYINGELYETIPLAQVTKDYTLQITTKDGGYNTILIQPKAISITAADCPDQICVKQGTITDNLLPITCLPHGLVIQLKPTNSNPNNAPDVITH